MNPTSLKLRGTRKDEATDHELLLLSIQEPAVFSRIVERYQEPFLKKAISIIGNEEDAQDIVQEAFVRMYVNAGKFERRAGASLSSWGYKILINTCFSHYKKSKRLKGRVSFDESIGLKDDEVLEEGKMEKFLVVLSRIPESFARILRELIVEGKSYEELARSENLSDNALRVRVHRAKQSFKKALSQNPNL